MKHEEQQLAEGMRAFGILYAGVEARLRETAIRMLRNPHEVAEFLQDCDAFLLIEASKTFKPELQSFTEWADRVTVNACRKRREILEHEIPLSELSENYPDPRDYIGDVETKVDYEIAIRKLPEQQRKCWTMRQEGYTNGEIARMLGITTEAAKKNVQRARNGIAGYMSPA